MKKEFIFAIAISLVFVSSNCQAVREELSDGSFVDEYGDIYDSRFENEDITAPWNDPLLQDDPFAPWNDPLMQDDPLAPWNDPIADERDTNRYLRESGERDADYYWR